MTSPSVLARREATPGLIDFIESVPFGSTNYRRIDLARTLGALDNATYLSLEDDDSVVGSYVLAGTGAHLDDEPIASVYRGLLAVDPALRRSGHGKRLVESAFEGFASANEPLITWGLIERENEASLGLLESLGSTAIASVSTRLVYRQWPKPSARFVRLRDDAERRYSALVSAPSAGLVLEAPSELPAYGLVEDGELLAAARISRAAVDLGPGGPLARFMHRYGYSRYRALGKRFNRRALRWLGIHDPLIVPGHAAQWHEFLSALFAEHDVHMALFTFDVLHEQAAMLDEAGLFGRFADATRQELSFVASGYGLPAGWAEKIRATPIRGGPVL